MQLPDDGATVHCREGFTRSGSPYRSLVLSLYRGSKTKCRLPIREAFDGQHQSGRGRQWTNTRYRVYCGVVSSFRFVSHFVSVIPVFTTTPRPIRQSVCACALVHVILAPFLSCEEEDVWLQRVAVAAATFSAVLDSTCCLLCY